MNTSLMRISEKRFGDQWALKYSLVFARTHQSSPVLIGGVDASPRRPAMQGHQRGLGPLRYAMGGAHETLHRIVFGGCVRQTATGVPSV